jgi:hypothetical protein
MRQPAPDDLAGHVALLNQRGGRALSLVDLVLAGTVSPELAAVLAAKVHGGASFLTGAVPGGAGKTTVLAALLGALPAAEPVITVGGPDDLLGCPEGPACLLAHEINYAPYLGYLWGADARAYFARRPEGKRVVSCMHADDIEEMRAMLEGPPNEVPPEHFRLVDLLLFLRVVRADGGLARRVALVYEAREGGHVLTHRWDQATDSHQQVRPSSVDPVTEAAALACITRLAAEGVREWERVRAALLADLASAAS